MRIRQQLKLESVPLSVSVALDHFLSLFSSEKLLSDRIFWMVFYVCVGLLPPLIAIIGHKAVYLPLLIISVLVIARLFMREDCRRRMAVQLISPSVLLLFSFALLVSVHALVGVIGNPERIRILLKPVIILLATTLLTFIWSHRDIIKESLLLKLALAGVLTGLSITILKVAVMHLFLGVGYQIEYGMIANFLHIHDAVNDELKILTVFVFIAVAAICPRKKRYIVLVGLLATIMAISFYTIGFTGGPNAVILRDMNETVQFGIPLAFLVLILVHRMPKLATNFTFTVMAFVLVSAPWLFQLWFRLIQSIPLPRAKKILIRGEIWDGVGSKVLEAPIFGFGIDTVRYLKNIDLHNKYMPHDSPHHPHNMVLQLWLDLGLVGVSIIAGLLYLAWLSISRIKPSSRPSILAGLTMLSIFILVTHSIWQTWSMALIVFFVALVSVQLTAEQKRHRSGSTNEK